MNRLRKIIAISTSIVVLLGCQKWIDPEINTNPDLARDVTINTILPALEANTAFKLAGGNIMQRIPSMWLQQIDGVARISLAETNYLVTSSSISEVWDHSYAEMLMDARMIIEKSNQQGSPHNRGVAKILTAFILGQLSDHWNDIPWTEALQGTSNMEPAFDKQESLYVEINKMLSEAITDLQSEEERIGIRGDYFYGGDTEKWIKAAHAFKARYAIHLSKRNGNDAYQQVLSEIGSSFTDNSDDMQFPYPGTSHVESNPLSQFMTIAEDVRMGAYFIDLLKSYNDPRLTVFALPDGNGEYTGSEPGSGNAQASMPGVAVAATDAPTFFITYSEILFMKAEAQHQLGQNEADVKESLLAAVTASLEKNGVMDTAWFSNYINTAGSLSGNNLFEEIMTQKYIATFYQPESYHSWRRTGIPELIPNPNGATNQIPKRFPYPLSVQLYNSNTPTGIRITDPVWWDE
jgi:hypothetical protein